MSCGIITFSSAENSGQQMVELVDEADADAADAPCAPASSELGSSSARQISTSPAVGAARAARRCGAAIDLPAPDWRDQRHDLARRDQLRSRSLNTSSRPLPSA
jgi:hypothetical protein